MTLSRYLESSPVILKGGHLRELCISFQNITENGGEIRLSGLQIFLASVSEEGLIFYDAVESSLLDGHHAAMHRFANTLAGDLRIVDFGKEIGSEVSTNGADLIEFGISLAMKRFKLIFDDIHITIQGSQTYQKLHFRLSNLEITQTASLDEIFIEVSGGLEISLVNRDAQRKIVAVDGPFPISIKLDEEMLKITAQLINPMVNISPKEASILMEFKRIYHHRSAASINFNTIVVIKAQQAICKLLSDEDGGQISVIADDVQLCNGANGGIEFTIMNIKATSLSDLGKIVQFKLERSPAESKYSATIEEIWMNSYPEWLINTYKSYFSEITKNSKKPKTSTSPFESVSIRVGKVSFANWKDVNSSLFLSEVEASFDPRQIVLHTSRAIFQSSLVSINCSRLSLYRSQRGTTSVATPSASTPPPLPSPFSDLITIIEGQEFIGSITNPEEYFLFRSKVIEQCEEHYHASVDKIIVSGDYTELKELRPHILEGNDGEKVIRRCFTASIFKVEFADSKMGISIMAEAIEGLYSISGGESIFDLRMDLASATLKNEITLARRAITVSLDPHFKPLIISNSCLQDDSSRFSVCLAGTLLTIPIYNADFQTLIEIMMPRFESQNSMPQSASMVSPSVYVQCSLCSVQSSLPSVYSVAPHVLYVEKARMILSSGMTTGRCFLQQGELFFAPGPGLVMEATGLFDEGHNYWMEQNYEAIIKFDFIPITIQKAKGWEMRIEDNMVTMDLHRDSLGTFLECLETYMRMIRDHRQGLGRVEAEVDVEVGQKQGRQADLKTTPKKEHSEHSALYDIGVPSPTFTFDESLESLEIEEDFYSKLPLLDEETAGVIEFPLPNTEDAEYKVLEEQVEEFQVDEDFLTMKSNEEISSVFPFCPPDTDDSIPLRMQIADFSMRIRLHSGRQWHPDRAHHISVKMGTLETSNGASPCAESSIFGSSLPEKKSTLSSSASSRWSNLGGSLKTSKTIVKEDTVEIVIVGLNAELDWTNPFPENLANAPDLVMTGLRLMIKKIEIVDRVRSSRWKTFMTRRVSKGDTRPMLQMRVGMHFVEREDQEDKLDASATILPRLHQEDVLPEDKLEASVKVDIVPLRLHIDQDTLLFLLQFIDTRHSILQGPTTASIFYGIQI